MANVPHHDTAPDTPKTPIKSTQSTDPAAPGKKFNSTPFARKLSGNPSSNKSLKHVHMDPALKEELAESQLIDVPGFVKHLFPDSIFPIPFDTLYNAVVRKRWYTQLNDWKAFFVRTYSGTSGGRVVPGEAETDLSKFLNTLNDTIRNTVSNVLPTSAMPSKRIWASESQKPLTGGPNAKRKPDVCLIDDGDDVKVTWSSTLVPVELKSKANEHGKAFLQLINSAYMIFSTQDERRFMIGVSLCGADVRVYVFDRAGVVGSTKFDFTHEPELLVRLFAGLMLSDVGGLGLDSSIRHEKDGSRYVAVANLEYQIIKTLFVSDSIRGRGTTCWQARRNGQDYVIKDTWTDMSRIQTEAEILRAAKGIQGVAQLVAEEVVQIDGKDDTTAEIRSIIAPLEEYPKMSWYEKVEVRLHRRLVTTPLAESLTNFRTKRELLQILIGAIEAHRRLVERHILHRDISINNVLIQRIPLSETAPSESCERVELSLSTPLHADEEVEKVDARGILIDLDYALITQDEDGNKFERLADPTGHRTGTLPFMATEILIGLEPGQEHQPHHDLESFFFILLWIALHYAGPYDVERRDIDVDQKAPVRGWLDSDSSIQELGLMKHSAMLDPDFLFNRTVGNLCTKYFKDLIPCINELRHRLFNPLEGVVDIPKITHRKMIDILQKHHNLLPEVENWSQQDDEEGYTGVKRKLECIQEVDEHAEAPNTHESPTQRKRARTSVTDLTERIPPRPAPRTGARKTTGVVRNSMPPPKR